MRGVTATAATVALLVTAAGTAYAGNDGRVSTSNKAGTAYFHSSGDWFTLTDNDFDGAGVWVQVRVGGITPNPPTLQNSKGFGSKNFHPYNFPEGQKVSFTVCLIDNGKLKQSTCRTGSGVA